MGTPAKAAGPWPSGPASSWPVRPARRTTIAAAAGVSPADGQALAAAFRGRRLEGLADAPARGPRGKSAIPRWRAVRLILAAARSDVAAEHSRPGPALGLSQTSISRIWRASRRQGKIEKSVAFSVMNSSRAGVPSCVSSTARLMAGTISPAL